MTSLIPASLLLGAIHGAALAVLLIRRAKNGVANRYLAGLLVALSLLLVNGYVETSGLVIEYPHLTGFAAPLPFLFGPLLWLYVREMTSRDAAGPRRPWPHFVPFVAYLAVLTGWFLARSAAYKVAFMADVMAGREPWLFTVTETLKFAHGFTYVIVSLILLRRHRPHVQALYSNLTDVSLRWLVILVVLNATVWGTAFVLFGLRISGYFGTIGPAAGASVAIGSTVVVFFIGYFQLGQTEIFAGQPRLAATTDPAPAPAEDPHGPPVAEQAPPASYQRARLPDADAADLEARLRAAMTEDRLYQRPGLTLAELADAVAATPHELSQVLSTRLQRNFYSFINEHRVEHAKQALVDRERREVSVLDVAFEAGFNSKSTFNHAFRRATGVTPSEFRRHGVPTADRAQAS